MQTTVKKLPKSQVEIVGEVPAEDFDRAIIKSIAHFKEHAELPGFRKGQAPEKMIVERAGEAAILEEAARIAINKTIDAVIKDNLERQPVGQPQVDITKLAPDNPLEYKVVLAIIPEVKLSDYKNAKIKSEKVEVKEAEADKVIKNLQDTRAKETIANRPAKEGDKVILDINIFLDKVPLEGGQGKDTAVIIGQDYLVPDFDKNIIGAAKTEIREFKLPYPANHYQKNLAGKLVEFKVKIKEVYSREMPELNDEFAKGFGLKSVAELKKNILENLKLEKEQKIEQQNEVKIIDKIMEKTKISDIPESLVEHESKAMFAELEHTIVNQGGKLEDYLDSLKKTRDQLILDLLPDAVRRVKSALVIREIALAEKIKVNPEEIDKKIKELLKQYKGYEKVEARVKEPGYRLYLENTLTNSQVLRKLKEWNIEE